MKKAIILFAHGSPDPMWHTHIDLISKKIKLLNPGVDVTCAYLNFTQPNLPEAVAELSACGYKKIKIAPIFLGIGKHLKEDLPMLVREIRIQHPEIEIYCQSAIGENNIVIDAIANTVLATDEES